MVIMITSSRGGNIMKKRFLSLGLAMAMAASLTACGSSSSTTETTTAAAADATTAAAGESTAASSEVFKIGGIGPVTGAAAVYGLAVKNGAQIAVDEINADGGASTATRSISSSRMMSMTQKNPSTLTTP